jgi:hypothetical protein
MENLITVNNNFNSLDKLKEVLKKESIYECSKEYDIWEMRTDKNGQMAQCIVVKKSNMHAVKLFFVNENTVKMSYIIPNKIMQAYFGKSVKARRNIIEIIAGIIKQAVLAGPQQKAFDELERNIYKIIAY